MIGTEANAPIGNGRHINIKVSVDLAKTTTQETYLYSYIYFDTSDVC